MRRALARAPLTVLSAGGVGVVVVVSLVAGCAQPQGEVEGDLPYLETLSMPSEVDRLIAELRVNHEVRGDSISFENPETGYADSEMLYYPTPVMKRLIRIGEEALPRLKAELAQAEGEYLGSLLFAIAKIGGEDALWIIREYLEEPNTFHAVRALEVLGDSRAVPFLGAIALDPKADPLSRTDALDALWQMDDLAVISIFIALLDDPDLGEHAKWGLHRWGIREPPLPGLSEKEYWQAWWSGVRDRLKDRWREEAERREWLFSWPYTDEKTRMLMEESTAALRQRLRKELERDPNARKRVP